MSENDNEQPMKFQKMSGQPKIGHFQRNEVTL